MAYVDNAIQGNRQMQVCQVFLSSSNVNFL